jgi:hypothetical protein
MYTLTGQVEVHTAPKSGSAVVGKYGKGSIFAVIGRARGTDYVYVSPCNAWENGFVLKSELFRKARG